MDLTSAEAKALVVLRAVAEARGAPLPRPVRVIDYCRSSGTGKDLSAIADDFEFYYLENPAGKRKKVVDVAKRWREWLERTEAVAAFNEPGFDISSMNDRSKGIDYYGDRE